MKSQMTPKEVIQATLRFEDLGFVPFHIWFDWSTIQRLNVHFGTDAWQKKVVHPYLCPFGMAIPFENIGDGLIKDKFGSIIKAGNIPHMIEPAIKEPNFDHFKWPEPSEIFDFTAIREYMLANEDKFRYCYLEFGYFERAMFLMGTEEFLEYSILERDFVEEYLDGYLAFRKKFYKLLVDSTPLEAIFGGGDDCDQRGCILGADRWRQLIKPRLADEIAFVHSLGKPYIMHCCGNVLPIIDDLIEIGIDVFDPVQPEPMDILELKNKVRKKVALLGGMGSQSTLPFGTPEEVRAKTRFLIEKLGEDGGYILCNAKPIFDDTSIENAVAFIEEALQGEPIL